MDERASADCEPYNAAHDLLERNDGGARALRPYLITDTAALTYQEVISRAHAIGAGLLGFGLTTGDRVILMARDSPEFVCTFWGAVRAGLVPVLVVPLLSASELRFILKDSGAKVLTLDTVAEKVAESVDLSGIVPVAVQPSKLRNAKSWTEVARGHQRISAIPTMAHDVGFWQYTSGTTGVPKAVMHVHAGMRAAPAGMARQVI